MHGHSEQHLGKLSSREKISIRHRGYLESISEILEYLERHLPRVKSFVDLFVVSRRIEKAVCGLYRDLIEFCVQTTNFIERHPIGMLQFEPHSRHVWVTKC